MNNLHEAVILLHQVAGMIEHEIGKGTLSEDVRKAADQLSDLIKTKYKIANNNA